MLDFNKNSKNNLNCHSLVKEKNFFLNCLVALVKREEI